MIFWNGQRILMNLVKTACVEAIYFNYSKVNPFGVTGRRNDGIFPMFMTLYQGVVFRNRICVFELRYKGSTDKKRIIRKATFTIPIINENSDCFPDRFAIRTKNIDLLRNLISEGKKVTWLDVDVYTQANWLGILDFEHVFIDPYINTHVIFPTGEVVKSEEAFHRNKFGGWNIKYAKKIGFYLKDLHLRINWKSRSRYRKKIGKKADGIKYIPIEAATNFYNINSLTYLIWQRSKLNAMNVKKKIVLKE